MSGTVLNKANAIYLGTSKANAVYAGADKVWPSLWSPSQVADLVLDATTLTLADGTPVANWQSSGSNTSYVAQQTNASQQPTLVATGLNGVPVVRFNSANDQYLTLNYHAGSLGFTQVVLAHLATVPTYSMVFVYDTPSSGWEIRCPSSNGYEQIAGGAMLASTTVNVVAGWNIFECIYDIATSTITGYVNGTSVYTRSGSPKLNADAQMWLARRVDNFAMNGDIACAVAVAGPLVDADRQKLEGWIAHRWGVTSILPPNHPYYTNPPGAMTA